MNQTPPQMPVKKNRRSILVIALATVSIVFSAITNSFGGFAVVGIVLSIVSLVLAFKEFQMQKEWIAALVLSVVSASFCVNMIVSQISNGIVGVRQRIYEERHYDTFDDFDDFFDDDDVDYFD